MAADEQRISLRIGSEYPCHVRNDNLWFTGEGWGGFLGAEAVFEMDPVRRAPAYLSGDFCGGFKGAENNPTWPGWVDPVDRVWKARQDGPELFSFDNLFIQVPTVGNVFVLRHFPRKIPGIFVLESRDTTLTAISLHHCGAMGILGQNSHNVTLDTVAVVPPPHSDRLFSVTVDATHFVNCSGVITARNCAFAGQLDDPLNIHGINTRIKSVLGRHELITELVHEQQAGVRVACVEDRLRLADNNTLLECAQLTVREVDPLNEQLVRLVFNESLPPQCRPGFALENLEWGADLQVSHCSIRPNRARGLLISTPGKVVVEECDIATSGSAFKISGDANFWFESGAVCDVTIRRNHFGDCCYGPAPWGRAVIDIDPEITEPYRGHGSFHRNILIEDNSFKTFDRGILYARSVSNLVFQRNRCERTDSYVPLARMDHAIELEDCHDVRINDNRFVADGTLPVKIDHRCSNPECDVPVTTDF